MEPGSPASRLRIVGEEDAAGWEALYRAHVVPIYRFVFSRCGNRPDAEDITATVFLRALPRLRPTAAENEARAYLRATARSLLAEHWAAHHRLVALGGLELEEKEQLFPAHAQGSPYPSNALVVATLGSPNVIA